MCISRAIPHKLAARIQPEILRRKKAVFRRHTLCMSRKLGAFPTEKSGCSPTTHLRGVAQGFTNAFLAEKIRQNSQTHLCGVASQRMIKPGSHPIGSCPANAIFTSDSLHLQTAGTPLFPPLSGGKRLHPPAPGQIPGRFPAGEFPGCCPD